MEKNEKLIGILNDLIRINNDRVQGYRKAIAETGAIDADLRNVFQRFADDSRKNTSGLTTEVIKLRGEAATGATFSGKVYRAWMDVKTTFTGKDRLAILELCEHGEDVAQEAYDEALASKVEIPAHIRTIITDQKADLKKAHDTVKSYRDLHAGVEG